MLSLCIAVLLTPSLRADDQTATLRLDTSTIAPLPFGSADSLIALYRDREEFNYDRELERSESLWDQFMKWLGDLFDLPSGSERAIGEVVEVLLYVLLGVVVIFIAIRLTGANVGSFFRRNRSGAGSGDLEEMEENLEQIDLEKRLADAERSGDFQRAVRWRYLIVLRDLERAGHIVYRPDRTNHEYLRALPAGSIREWFATITRLFEYAWYGRLPLDAGTYARMTPMFDPGSASTSPRYDARVDHEEAVR